MVQAAAASQQLAPTQKINTQTPAGANVNVQPRFFFGLKGDVKNAVLFLDDNVVAYPCGHNVVIYYMNEKMQRFIPGIEGSQGITCMALSPSRKFLAVCEKATNAICTVYNVGKFLEMSLEKRSQSIFEVPLKKRKILCSTEDPAKEFVSVDFCPRNEKLIVTASAKADARVTIWNWDKQRCVVSTEIMPDLRLQTVDQVSFSNVDQSVVIVTGKELYRYYKVDGTVLKHIPIYIHRRENDTHFSNNYTCHAWLNEGRFVIANDHGQIMLLDAAGEYKGITVGDPRKDNFAITAITTFSGVSVDGGAANQGKANSNAKSGFIIAGESGRLRVFVKSEADPKKPYVRVDTSDDLYPAQEHYLRDSNPASQMVFQDIDIHKITSVALSPQEDVIVFTTSSSQIIKVTINLERPNEDQKYEHLISSFHSKQIHGLDVCVKKELIATCSSDRTVRLWSYTAANQFQSELCYSSEQEAHAIAFHPSGLHLVVGFSDSVRLMNILDKHLDCYKTLMIKECREIVFSNGGHLFACQNDKEIWVYKFYTASIPQYFKFVAHQQPVKRIAWLEDDTGFVTCGQDAMIYVWKLYPQGQETNPVWSFKLLQKISFSSVACFKPEGSLEPLVYATGSDRSIREISKEQEMLRYEENLTYSQVLVGYQRNLIYAGLAEPNRPGSIQIFRYANDTMEKAVEVQAHSQQIERMRLNYDNSKLFSIGIDGTLACFSIKDSDPVAKAKNQQQPTIHHSEEILIEKVTLDSIQKRIKTLKVDIDLQERTRDMQLKQTMAKNDEEIRQLEEEIEEQKSYFEDTTRRLTMEKEQVDQRAEEEQNYLRKIHEEELKVKKQEYAEKMLADKERKDALLNSKEEQKLDFEKNIQELFLQQDKAKAEMQQEHALQKQQKDNEYKEKQRMIEELERANIDERKKIEEEAWIKIDELKDRNKEELSEIIKDGMKNKSDLQKETGKFRTANTERDTLTKEIKEKAATSRTLDQAIVEFKNQIEAQKAELESRRATIEDKDARIIELKKKTQELEKFKFVLDYKIKELKRDILPRENNIASLHEQVNTMQIEVRHFQRISDNLDLIVNDLKMRHKGLEDENLNCGHRLDMQQLQKNRFKDDVFEVVQHITDYKKLKRGVIRLYKIWVKEETNRKKAHDQNDAQTGERHTHETHIGYYRQQLSRNLQQHRENNSRLMKDNVYLIKRINEMRKEEHLLQKQIQLLKQGKESEGRAPDETFANEQRKELELMDMTIGKIQADLQAAQLDNQQLRERRPPRNLAPLQQDNQLVDMDGEQAPMYEDGDMMPQHEQDVGEFHQEMDPAEDHQEHVENEQPMQAQGVEDGDLAGGSSPQQDIDGQAASSAEQTQPAIAQQEPAADQANEEAAIGESEPAQEAQATDPEEAQPAAQEASAVEGQAEAAAPEQQQQEQPNEEAPAEEQQ